MDTILQLDVVLAFRREIQPYLKSSDGAGADVDPQHLQQPPLRAGQQTSNTAAAAPDRYVTQLLSKAKPSTVQQVLDWRVQDWIQFLRDTSPRLSLLLQMTTGSSSGYLDPHDDTQAVPHLLLASQQLSKVCRCCSDMYAPVSKSDMLCCKKSPSLPPRGTVSHQLCICLAPERVACARLANGRELPASACLPVPHTCPQDTVPCAAILTHACAHIHRVACTGDLSLGMCTHIPPESVTLVNTPGLLLWEPCLVLA